MSIDQRRAPRIEFFLLPEAPEPLPADEVRGGIVVNLSEAGLQVLTLAEPPLEAEHYTLRLLFGGTGEGDEGEGPPLLSADVRRVWSRALDGGAQLGGFEFESANAQAEEFLLAQTAQITARQRLYCVLVENDPAGALH